MAVAPSSNFASYAFSNLLISVTSEFITYVQRYVASELSPHSGQDTRLLMRHETGQWIREGICETMTSRFQSTPLVGVNYFDYGQGQKG